MKIINDRVYPETPLAPPTTQESKGYGVKTYNKFIGAFLASKPIAWLFGKKVKLVTIREDFSANEKEVYVNINSLAQYAFRKNLYEKTKPAPGSFNMIPLNEVGEVYAQYKSEGGYSTEKINALREIIVKTQEPEKLDEVIRSLRTKLDTYAKPY